MYTITKRNGSVAEFDVNKIKNAITKAFEACRQEYHPDGIDFLVLKVMSDFEKKVKNGKITVEEIQDSVESVLGKAGYDEVAKAYILYRRQHEKLRDAAASVIDYKKVMDGYLKVNDWRVKENSTVTYSVGGLILSNSGAMTANYWLSEVYDEEIGNAHRNADIHLHDLSMLTGYCFTGDTRVKTLDGKNPTFKELVDRGVNELWVYAYDRDRKEVVPAKAIAPRVTRMTQEMIRLSLCTGVQIECTPDHLFMMRDGSFRPAKDLHPNDSVMPLYISEQGKICTVEKVHYAEPIPVYDLTVPEYENFAIEGNVFVHNCAGWSLKQLIQEGLGGVEGKITSAPAQHLSTLCNQMVNFLGILQNEWAGAQAFSSFDTYLAPFAKKDCLTYKEVKQCIQSFIYGVNTPSRWGCCPITTKVATPNGFKSVDELKVGDVIYTWLNGTLHEAPLEHIIRRKNDYNVLHRYKGVNYVQTVTPEHRCLVEMGSKRGKYGIRQSMDIFGKRGDLRMPMCIKDVDVAYSDDYSDDEIILAAMMYTDGGKDMNDIRITKSVIRDTGLIRAVLERLGLTYTVYERKESTNDHMIRTYRISDQHREYIQTLIGDKYAINDDFCHLGREQSELFIRTWAAFDGNVSGRIACQYDNENIRNSLELIMLRAGYVSHVWSRKKPADKNATNYLYAENRMSAVISEQEEIPYDGEVWCPNTKDGTAIYKDENGNIFISGNCQAPFTNITLDWTVPADLAELNCIVGGKEMDFKYKDCQKEMDMVNKAFIEIMIEGDANGRGFQYPIPTYSITRDFDWSETENNKLLFEMTAKYGTPYFSNYVNSDMEPSDVRSMCCRLRLDLRELRKKSGGFFGSGESTGSIGVVTINMPRIAFLSKDEKEFYARLDKMMDISARSLKTKRNVITNLLENGLYPYTKRYLGTFNNHFSTIGLVGMNEACLNARWIGEDLTNEKAQKFTQNVLNHMRERLSDYQEQYGDLYNLEATPAESTSFRLAKHDVEKYPGIITAAKSGDDTPYYTNSSHLPVGYTEDIFSALDIQDKLQTLYTSGTVFHAFLGEKLPDWKAAATLVRKIAENYKLPYYTMSPTYSVCRTHGYLSGEQKVCPICGEVTEVYSRITGYYRPVKNWNDGKTQEYKDRKVYDLGIIRRKTEEQEVEECEACKMPAQEQADMQPQSDMSLADGLYLFASATCPNCKIAAAALDKAGIVYEKILANDHPDLAKQYGIRQAPTLVIVMNGDVEKVVGVGPIKGRIAR